MLTSELALQCDGKVVICGWFTNVNGIRRARIARLDGHAITLPRLDDPHRLSDGSFGCIVCGEVGRAYTILASTNLIDRFQPPVPFSCFESQRTGEKPNASLSGQLGMEKQKIIQSL